MITKKCLFLIKLIPVKNIVKEIKKEIRPTDWKKRSEIILPLMPKIFFISVFLGNIKFGSSGEQDNREINSNNPAKNITIPKISAKRLNVKLINKLAVFLIFIQMNQLYHFVSSNFYC